MIFSERLMHIYFRFYF